MPLGSIPDMRTRPERIAGAAETSGHHITEFLPAPEAPAVRQCAPEPRQRDTPVVPVLGATGPRSPQIHTGRIGRQEIGHRERVHNVAEQVSPLEVDRHHVRCQLPHLAPGDVPGRGQRTSGVVEVLRLLAGHQLNPHLIPRRTRPDTKNLGHLHPGLPSRRTSHPPATDQVDRHFHRQRVIADAEAAGVQPAGKLEVVHRPARPPGAQQSPAPLIERHHVDQSPHAEDQRQAAEVRPRAKPSRSRRTTDRPRPQSGWSATASQLASAARVPLCRPTRGRRTRSPSRPVPRPPTPGRGRSCAAPTHRVPARPGPRREIRETGSSPATPQHRREIQRQRTQTRRALRLSRQQPSEPLAFRAARGGDPHWRTLVAIV